jgi:ABC-type sugar transport system ATPase subunit
VVEHDMEFIRMIASTVTVFNRGEVLMEDSCEAVMRDERVRDVYLGRELHAVLAEAKHDAAGPRSGFRLRRIPILNAISMDVAAGEFLGVATTAWARAR